MDIQKYLKILADFELMDIQKIRFWSIFGQKPTFNPYFNYIENIYYSKFLYSK
jgi:hypothetical protein